jgi:signal transduction histidine kinase
MLADFVDKRRLSFRHQLLVVATLGLFSLAIAETLTTTWLVNRHSEDVLLKQARLITDNLAEQSLLAVLYQSVENARLPIEHTLKFPGVDAAAIVSHELGTVHQKGSFPAGINVESLSLTDNSEPISLDNGWIFYARILSDDGLGQDDPFGIGENTVEELGIAVVFVTNALLQQTQREVLLNNMGVAFVIALVLAGLVNFGVNRLVRPMSALAKVMIQVEEEGEYRKADSNGPLEIRVIAHTFNQMMDALKVRDDMLRRHKDHLEHEVTMRTKDLEQARDAALIANRHKSAFLANVSHELRTPLQSIIGYTEVVKEELELEGLDNYINDLDTVIRNAERLLALINNTLDLAKVEAGKMEVKLDDYELQPLLREAVDTITPILDKNNNEMSTRYPDDYLCAFVDREKLLQVIINLLSNANKFTSGGKISLGVSFDDNWIMVAVVDTGIGLSEAQQEEVFNEFSQVDHGTDRGYEGTGLGLAICQHFCKLMGGDIGVESELGQGATFIVKLPRSRT